MQELDFATLNSKNKIVIPSTQGGRMTEETVAQPSADERTGTEKVPWYSLNPRHLHFSKATWTLLAVALVIFLFYGFSIKPLWQFGWRHHLYTTENLWPEKSATGKKFASGSWVKSRKIIVYGAPKVSDAVVKDAADGMRSMVEEMHLDITVSKVPAPPEALRSIEAATICKHPGDKHFNMDKFIEHRLDDRGMQYAEMVVVDGPFTDPEWAWGLTYFAAGVSVLQETNTTRDLGRHEGTHLLGYNRHDDLPFYVLGYPEGLIPSQRDTLMMLLPKHSDQLSPRARDAVRQFWLGMETKDVHYFK